MEKFNSNFLIGLGIISAFLGVTTMNGTLLVLAIGSIIISIFAYEQELEGKVENEI